MPQPAAQGQPESWPTGDCEEPTDVAELQMLKPSEPPAATDSGSNSACSPIT